MKNWEEKIITDLCENLDSKRIPITKGKRIFGTIPYYGASGIVDYVNDYIFEGDYLLISEDGANLLARTYPIAFSVSGKFWVNNHAHILKFENSFTQRFVEFYLNSIDLKDFISGMAQPKLNQSKLNSIKIPIPPLEEQQKIVEKLDKAFELLDQAKANIEKNIQNAKELFQSKLDEVFSQQGEGWVDCKFKDVLDIINGKNQKDVESINGEFPIYGSAGKVMGYASNYLCPENTIIIGRKGTIDNPLFIDHKFWNVDTAFGLKSKGDILDKLLYYYTKTIDFKSMDKGTTLPSLTKKDLLEVGISFPSDLKKQNELLSVLDRLSQDVSNLNQKYQQKLSNIEELRKSILEKAFKGELTN